MIFLLSWTLILGIAWFISWIIIRAVLFMAGEIEWPWLNRLVSRLDRWVTAHGR